MRGLTLKQMRALSAVVGTGTVTGAARILNVTPPAVTAQIQSLEAICGLPLLDRVGDRFIPTEAGREVLAATERIEARLRDCEVSLESLKGLVSGRVSVGVVSTAKYFAPQALGAFVRGHPGVDVSLFVGNREAVVEALRTYGIDIAVMGRPPSGFEVEYALIGDHPHVIVAAPDHRLAGRKRFVPQGLSSETFLVREQGSGTRTLMENLFAHADIAPKIGMEIGSNETIKQAVIAGLGIALISAHTVAHEIADGRLVILDVEGLPIVRQWFVVKHAEKRLLPAAAAMLGFLSSFGASFLPPPGR